MSALSREHCHVRIVKLVLITCNKMVVYLYLSFPAKDIGIKVHTFVWYVHMSLSMNISEQSTVNRNINTIYWIWTVAFKSLPIDYYFQCLPGFLWGGKIDSNVYCCGKSLRGGEVPPSVTRPVTVQIWLLTHAHIYPK